MRHIDEKGKKSVSLGEYSTTYSTETGMAIAEDECRKKLIYATAICLAQSLIITDIFFQLLSSPRSLYSDNGYHRVFLECFLLCVLNNHTFFDIV